jgi:diguanylate cyclase (GGDEF)-like protein/PAS domain S-box-containing protein
MKKIYDHVFNTIITRKTGFIILVFLSYILLFFPLFSFFQRQAIAFYILPTIVVALMGGRWWGLTVGFLYAPINHFLFLLVNTSPIGSQGGRNFWFSFFVFIITGSVLGYLRDIKNQLQEELDCREAMEDALHQSEGMYKQIVETASDVIAVFSPKGDITYVNPPTVNLTGYSEKELVGMNYSELIHEDWREKIVSYYLNQRNSKNSESSLEFPFTRKNGETKWVKQTVNLVFEGEEVTGVQSILHDITDRKDAEHSLKETELRYQALFDRSNDGVFIISLDQVFLSINQKAADLLGYSIEELTGLSVKDVVSPEEFETSQNRAEDILHGEIPPTYERTFIRKDGTQVVGEISAALVHDANGNPSYIQSTVRDITKRKQVEKKLQENEFRYQALFNQSNDAVLLITLDGNIINVNERTIEMHGFSREELIGKSIKFLSTKREQVKTEKMLSDISSGEAPPVYERMVRHKNGSTFPIEINLSLVIDANGDPLYAQSIARDISQRKQIEENLHHLATHDPLTGLPNRTLFYDRLNHATNRAKRDQTSLAILFLDLDGFKNVNDTYGHLAGDKLLKDVAERLQKCVRESDTVARMSGDEFTIILENVEKRKNTQTAVENIIEKLSKPYHVDGQKTSFSASIGVALFPADTDEATEVLKKADQAMYAVKNDPKKKKWYQFYEDIQ